MIFLKKVLINLIFQITVISNSNMLDSNSIDHCFKKEYNFRYKNKFKTRPEGNMHETAMMQNLISVAMQSLKNYNVKQVNCVNVSVGKLANVLPDALNFAFEATIKGTIMDGAKLNIKFLPIIACCDDCKYEYETKNIPFVCPICNSNKFMILHGEEVYIDSIDCEEE